MRKTRLAILACIAAQGCGDVASRSEPAERGAESGAAVSEIAPSSLTFMYSLQPEAQLEEKFRDSRRFGFWPNAFLLSMTERSAEDQTLLEGGLVPNPILDARICSWLQRDMLESCKTNREIGDRMFESSSFVIERSKAGIFTTFLPPCGLGTTAASFVNPPLPLQRSGLVRWNWSGKVFTYDGYDFNEASAEVTVTDQGDTSLKEVATSLRQVRLDWTVGSERVSNYIYIRSDGMMLAAEQISSAYNNGVIFYLVPFTDSVMKRFGELWSKYRGPILTELKSSGYNQ